jgi:asparagine synthase (glutamine-hydrolysing)
MCGINGVWMAGGGAGEEFLRDTAVRMRDTLRHRGPDAEGVWTDAEAGLALGHRRLSILELSSNGAQPMASRDGRYVLSFNGELYNHLDVRREIDRCEPVAWRGHSDTETLVEAIAILGFETALDLLHGMFAFAIWDRRERTLRLAVDRMGEKPLYYGRNAAMFFFASESGAFRTLPGWKGEVNREALSLLLRFNSIPPPHSIYRDVWKLEPGCFLEVTASGSDGHRVKSARYWDLRAVAEQAFEHRFQGSPAEAVDALDARLRAVISRQMLSDVPLGAFLSGGVDSSTIVALMQAQSSAPVKTFTIGFESRGHNEADDARRVATHLGTEHTELRLGWRDALELIPRLPEIWSEPFGDSSQLPTLLVSQLARRQVTVSLSGDAGDELFAGYNRHQLAHGLGRRLDAWPRPLKVAAARALSAASPRAWDRAFSRFNAVLPGAARLPLPGEKIHKLADCLVARDGLDLYKTLVSNWRDPSLALPGVREPAGWIEDARGWKNSIDPVERMMLLDMLTYLPGDILTKVDRASMAVSLESRVPFLDPDLVAFALSLPLSLKLREGQGKWILRQVLYRYVPRALIDRPKQGFAVPLEDWLRGPLRDWAEALLDPARLRREGYFEPGPVRRLWEAHLSGKSTEHHALWNVLMFQAWLEKHGGAA